MSFITQAYLLERYRPRLTMQELAEVLGVAHGTLRNRIARGDCGVRTYIDGGTRWADVRDVATYLDECREGSQAEGEDTGAGIANHGAL